MKRLLITFLVLLCVMGSLFAFEVTNGAGSNTANPLVVTLTTSSAITNDYKFWIRDTYSADAESDLLTGTASNLSDGTYGYRSNLFWEVTDGAMQSLDVTFAVSQQFTGQTTPTDTITTDLKYPAGGYFNNGIADASQKAATGGDDIAANAVTSDVYTIAPEKVGHSGMLPFTVFATVEDINSAKSDVYTANVTVTIAVHETSSTTP